MTCNIKHKIRRKILLILTKRKESLIVKGVSGYTVPFYCKRSPSESFTFRDPFQRNLRGTLEPLSLLSVLPSTGKSVRSTVVPVLSSCSRGHPDLCLDDLTLRGLSVVTESRFRPFQGLENHL